MGTMPPVSLSGNISLPQQDDVDGVVDAFNNALKKYEKESSESKSEQGHESNFFTQRDNLLPMLLASLRNGIPGKKEQDSEKNVAQKGKDMPVTLLRASSGKPSENIAEQAPINKAANVNLLPTAIATVSEDGIANNELAIELQASSLTGSLPQKEKMVITSGVPKNSLVAEELSKDDGEIKKTRDIIHPVIQQPPQSGTNIMAGGVDNQPSMAPSRSDMNIFSAPEASEVDKRTLTYRFQQWGNGYSVNIQSAQIGELSLTPSNRHVEQRLNEQWQSGNPERWHLTRDGQQSQQQHKQQHNNSGEDES